MRSSHVYASNQLPEMIIKPFDEGAFSNWKLECKKVLLFRADLWGNVLGFLIQYVQQ